MIYCHGGSIPKQKNQEWHAAGRTKKKRHKQIGKRNPSSVSLGGAERLLEEMRDCMLVVGRIMS